MKKSSYAIILGLLFITSFSCSSDDDNIDTTGCIDPNKKEYRGMCPAVVIPVCGCDGKSYNNDCEATAHGVLHWTTGRCQ